MTTTTPETPTAEPRRRVRHSGPGAPLTDEQAATLAAHLPDDPIPLSPSDCACRDCGVTVAGPLDLGAITYAEPSGVALGDNGAVSSSVGGLHAEPLALCSTCADRHNRADRIAASVLPHGLTVAGLHHADAAPLVRSCLVVLDVLDHRPPAERDLTPDLLGLMVRNLAPVGAVVGWSRRFAPIRAFDARPGTANPRPWAHLRESDRRACRRAWVGCMADRLAASAPPVNLTPPARLMARPGTVVLTSACLLCGVGSIERPALAVARDGGREAAALKVWEVRTTAPDALGARRSPASLAGWTCPPCSEACHWAGAVGPSAMERALLVALGLTGRHWPTSATMPGLIGWGALAADAARRGQPIPAPNPTPWAHLGDLDTLRSRLGHDLGGQ